GATMLTFGSPFWTSIGTEFLPTLTPEKLPVTRRTLLSKCCTSAAVPITVTLTAGTSPTRTRPAGRVGWSMARGKPLLWVGFEVLGTRHDCVVEQRIDCEFRSAMVNIAVMF